MVRNKVEKWRTGTGHGGAHRIVSVGVLHPQGTIHLTSTSATFPLAKVVKALKYATSSAEIWGARIQAGYYGG